MKKPRNNVKFGNVVLVVAFFLFVIIILRGAQLSLSTNVDGINLAEFASKRTTAKDIIPAKRGTIYDVNGEVFAENVYSYTVIAYLDPTRTTNPDKPKHVVDIPKTAKSLAPILGMEEAKVTELLSKKGVYQTEFGANGKGITEITKDKIVALQLPGIDFIERQKRYYPNGNFLSYTLGYAKTLEDGNIVGEMGIEQYYNDTLSGVDGSITYQKDLKGYKIVNTPEIKVDAISGKDVYLTIDNNIQFFIEQAIKNSASKYTFENLSIMIADAKTGKIVGSSTYPSFDPNLRNITSYLDPNISVAFEPGSTMKIFTYMAAMEAGTYKGDDTFKSGVYVTKDGTEIGDSNRQGWGTISFDRGFALSSNVGVINLIERYMDSKTLKDYYRKLGFGSKTGITLPKEVEGKIDFKYETEVFNAGFGQGIMTTPIQYVKALTSLGTGGILLQPYIVDKIVDPDTKKILFKGEKNEIGRVASEATVEKLKKLMLSVVEEGTGTPYKMEGYDLIAKTGTAQISSTNGTGYLKGKNDVIRGFAGLYPGNSPKFIIYGTVKKPNPNSTAPLSSAIKEIIQNISKYMNISTILGPVEEINKLVVNSYYNKKIEDLTVILNSKKIETVVIGNGDRVIKQYPLEGVTITSKEKLFLVSNGESIVIPNMQGWSRKEVTTYFNLIGASCSFEGVGYVKKQSIPPGTILTKEMIMEINLEQKFTVS
ncbi:MAG: penicillin-binding transpeptidase domain-containing protein [Bacilli bacterium]